MERDDGQRSRYAERGLQRGIMTSGMRSRGGACMSDGRKAGYWSFLDLDAELVKSNKKDRNHFGFSPEKMLALATDGVK